MTDQSLVASAPHKPETDGVIMIRVWTTSAPSSGLPFRRDWLTTTFVNFESLIAVTISGDAMAPRLANGCVTLVDRSQASVQGDGIYILLAGNEAVPRRLSLNPLTGHVSITADNRLYQSQPDCDPRSLSILGRVVWVGQCL
ncbi:S24 family peptidase [Govanella unica]|uniref:S24 family peptidase n=1 Tax=Govanella unica TaxID=2975056 RepID=A0A9X3TXJ4_9PROT|nr:S24 family peptidase [Govania unica]MDA5193525.1 S24 family peptidase [Govania unica]